MAPEPRTNVQKRLQEISQQMQEANERVNALVPELQRLYELQRSLQDEAIALVSGQAGVDTEEDIPKVPSQDQGTQVEEAKHPSQDQGTQVEDDKAKISSENQGSVAEENKEKLASQVQGIVAEDKEKLPSSPRTEA